MKKEKTMAEGKRMGKGLDFLLSAGKKNKPAAEGGVPPSPESAVRDGELRHIPVDLIQRGKYQPLTDMH